MAPNMFPGKILFFFVVFYCVVESSQVSQVPLVLYYEPFNPKSQAFILQQLYPGLKELNGSLTVDLVPYGLTTYTNNTNGSIDFKCTNGANECIVIKIQSCVISLNTTQDKLMDFINCNTHDSSSSQTETELLEVSKACAQKSNLSYDSIYSCVYSTKSDQLLVDQSTRIAAVFPKIFYVPSIRFFDGYNYIMEQMAKYDLITAVCALLDENVPSICNFRINNN